MKMTDAEKLILVMLSEIHQKLQIENGVDSKLVQEAIYSGNLWALKETFTGIFHGSEPPPEVIREATEILDMWRYIESSYDNLSPDDKARIEKEAEPFGKYVQFNGFDGNGEAQYMNVAGFHVDQLEHFERFKGRDLNAHLPTLDTYRRMLAVFGPLRNSLGGKDLSASDIIEILRAKQYPESRTRTAAN